MTQTAPKAVQYEGQDEGVRHEEPASLESHAPIAPAVTNAVNDDHMGAEDMGFEETVPSWFSRRTASTQHDADGVPDPLPPPQFRASYQPLSAAQQNDAAESYRRRLEERFRLAQHMAAPEHMAAESGAHASIPPGFPQRPAAPSSQHYGYDNGYVAASTPQTARNPLGVSVPVALVLLSVASCIGALGGYVSANPGVTANMMPTSLLSLWPFSEEAKNAQVATSDSAIKKDMPSARVNVADVEGAVNAPIPLEISAYPAEPGTALALKISGLPDDAYLTRGEQVASGEWLVRAEDIQSAELVVKSSEQPELGLLVTALEADSGAAAAPAQSMKVALNLDAVPAPGLVPPPEEKTPQDETRIEPVNAVPETALPKAVATPDRFQADEVASYLEKGEMLLMVGDIVAARQFFLRAYELKSPDGAYGVARTYDPVVFRKLNVQGMKPNAAKAAEWYGKAAAQGHAGAETALAQPPL